jgi:oxygen-independent coproporphyrinogen-3 oxidase
MPSLPELLRKYNQPSPRYTSYPPVPDWETKSFSATVWKNALVTFWSGPEANAPAQLYIHLPYCESLCTFCACNKRITQNHQLEDPHITAVLKEWAMYRHLYGGPIPISEIHLGGGTPTFFSEDSLSHLTNGILSHAQKTPDFEMGIEVHPGTTTTQMVHHLYSLGFTRISMGIKDFSPIILEKINRFQSFEQTRELVNEARNCGYHSINFDLVYGLPFQKISHIEDTFSKVIQLNPDRIAFYGYAHVPWISKGQRHFTEADLPEPDARWALFEKGKEMLAMAGYMSIGMDHFAKPGDALSDAFQDGTLHRNFMGYTEQNARLLIGLGACAISETPHAYAQNEPVIEAYLAKIEAGAFPINKGHLLTETDKIWKHHIMDLMCKQKTDMNLNDPNWLRALNRVAGMRDDGLISLKNMTLHITYTGMPFMRTICYMLDHRHWENVGETRLFSALV